MADRMFHDGPLGIVFHEDQPCAVPAAEAAITAYGAKSELKAATVRINGRVSAGCWALDVDGDYIVMDERGSGGVIFAHAVKEPKGST
jgi:hypothetical protein